MSGFKAFYSFLIWFGSKFQSVWLLVIRLIWGLWFFDGGIDKFKDIPRVVEFFTQLGIPWPEFNVYLVATVETVGGICLILGLFSRLVAIPLIITMCVAYSTANFAAIAPLFTDPMKFNLVNFVGAEPFHYLMTALFVFSFGPGIFSLDALGCCLFGSKCEKKEGA